MDLPSELKKRIVGDVSTDAETIERASHDASIFEMRPSVVVFPKNSQDIKALVRFVSEEKENNPALSLTARAAGTCMSGGPLTTSISVAFTKYMNAIGNTSGSRITAEPGAYYRDFEKKTISQNLLLPSFPASREMCAIGGMIANNAGGEKNIKYGKTERYVKRLWAVLSDGNEYEFAPLSERELEAKLHLPTFEGDVYRGVSSIVREHHAAIENARPHVSKNSAGYALWNVWNPDTKIFDLTKLFVGSQGTLGLITKAEFELVPVQKHSQMIILFLPSIDLLSELTSAILPHKPESFEAYDDHTLKLALKFFPSFARLLGLKNLFSFALHFLPELFLLLRGGLPKLILQAEFTGDDLGLVEETLRRLEKDIKPFGVRYRIAKSASDVLKYKLIRRESFNLLRNRIKDRHTAPFIDDFVVNPEKLEEFLPKLNEILSRYNLIYTIAGHMGDGNFHIIPLMNFHDPSERAIIPELSKKVYDLVFQYHGSTTGEHNDGLVRGPFLKQMFGEDVYRLFVETKRIFDPKNIFNPNKKIGVSMDYAFQFVRKD
ncbi:MAG: hypothetical protein A2847_00190 [Candidatus Sungbacteria bacterium RIFCSPHIGHO2_01_FULL_50_25]|uniref:FAD-binding PCMH-type domain-containing protein n=1 Tax=Candidatus Sungbacteria bacterium RIFCSPHIGHO2_01_FULL_50_25 TaxID=1802265 RepID=A0A1G2KAJ6_9BACT|nr:MAG: hypothetical protein A2847_00190 [Candidatus Sungbacteria bacterium RIFCSPHIGHO2_01_FULL_50_25]